MDQIGTTLPVFVGLTLIVGGAAAFMTGVAVAGAWKPAWIAVGYALLLAVADRFLHFALFGGALFSVPGFLASVAVLSAVALLAYRLTRVRKMVAQYPWEIEQVGLFRWRRIGGGE